MGDVGDDYRFLREKSKEKRESNRESSRGMLVEAGIPFEDKNGGAHLIVTAANGEKVDFWPGTGLWQARHAGRRGRGVRKLLGYLASVEAV